MPATNRQPGRLRVRGATVLTMDPALGDLDDADVIIEAGRFVAVRGRRAADAAAEPAAAETVIDGRGLWMVPGLIDTHTHCWQGPLKGLGAAMWGMADYTRHVFSLRERFGAGDMADAAFATGIEMLDHGITTVLDFCHNVMTPAHAEASLQGHRGTGQRVLFGYGMLGRFETLAADHRWRLEQVRALQRQLAGEAAEVGQAPPDALLRLGLALGSIEFTGIDRFMTEHALGRELGLPMTFHQNVAGQIHDLAERGLLGPDLLPVHCNPALDAELRLLAEAGACLSATPESEIGDGRSTRVIARADVAGVRPSLGIDVPSRIALDLFAQMRTTFLVLRAEEAEAERNAGRWPLARYPGVPRLQPRHLLAYVTVNAAAAIGLGDRLGRIAPGCLADFLLISPGDYLPSLGDPAAHLVLQTTPADVDTVVVGGRIRKRGGRLVDGGRQAAREAARRVRRRVLGDETSKGDSP